MADHAALRALMREAGEAFLTAHAATEAQQAPPPSLHARWRTALAALRQCAATLKPEARTIQFQGRSIVLDPRSALSTERAEILAREWLNTEITMPDLGRMMAAAPGPKFKTNAFHGMIYNWARRLGLPGSRYAEAPTARGREPSPEPPPLPAPPPPPPPPAAPPPGGGDDDDDAGADAAPPPGSQFARDKAEALRRLAEGEPTSVIADELGYPPSMVATWRREAREGLPA